MNFKLISPGEEVVVQGLLCLKLSLLLPVDLHDEIFIYDGIWSLSFCFCNFYFLLVFSDGLVNFDSFSVFTVLSLELWASHTVGVRFTTEAHPKLSVSSLIMVPLSPLAIR